MRILIAIDNFKVGGAERVASLLANELCQKHEVHAIVFDDEINYPLRVDKIVLHNISTYNGNRIIRMVLRLIRYIKLLNKIHPDVIYSFAYLCIYSSLAYKLSTSKKAKLICSERTNPDMEPRSNLMKLLRNKAYASGEVLVCQTKDAVDYFKKKKINVEYSIIPNPITSNLPQWNGRDSYTFITACRYEEQKNIPMMINAFAIFGKKYPKYRLEIYGDGSLKKQLKEKIEKDKLIDKIVLKEFTKELHSIMCNSFAYISSSNYEGISNSMLEALGIGMPTICTDCPVGGAAMFINSGVNGFLVPVGDVYALSNSLCNLVEMKQDLWRISSEARKINDAISVDKITQMWVELIDHIL